MCRFSVLSEVAKPLQIELTDDLRLVDLQVQAGRFTNGDGTEVDSVEMLVTVPMGHLDVGRKDLVAELDDPVLNDFGAEARVSREFVRGIIPTYPPDVVNRAIDEAQSVFLARNRSRLHSRYPFSYDVH